MHQRSYESSSEGLTDTTKLSDDHRKKIEPAGWGGPENFPEWQEASYMRGRWAHLLDAHIEETRNFNNPPYFELPDKNWCHIKGSKYMREQRFMRLSWLLEALRVHIKRRRRSGRNVTALQHKVHVIARGVTKRYRASIDLIVSRGSTDWYLLYLTKAQHGDLITLARDAYLGR
jgi:hypothetical protein